MLEPRIVGSVLRRFDRFHRLFKVDEDAHVVLDELGGKADGILRVIARWSTLRSSTFRSRSSGRDERLRRRSSLAHRRMHAVDWDVADGQIFIIVAVAAT